MADFDRWTEKLARGLARGTSRRSSLAWLGALATGAAAIPALPVARAATPAPSGGDKRPPVPTGNPQDPGDATTCEYWRYCAIDGFLCTCCGGTVNTCPPGTEMSPITLDRHLHQPGRRPSLRDQLQRLLRRLVVRAMPVQPQRGRSPTGPPASQ